MIRNLTILVLVLMAIKRLQDIYGRSTTSDLEGNFRMKGLEPSLYTIVVYVPAYTMDRTEAATHYRLGDSARVQLIRGGVITGTVMNALGEPVIGVSVRVTRIRDAKGQAQNSLIPSEPDKAEDVLRFFVTDIASDGTFRSTIYRLASTSLSPKPTSMLRSRRWQNSASRKPPPRALNCAAPPNP